MNSKFFVRDISIFFGVFVAVFLMSSSVSFSATETTSTAADAYVEKEDEAKDIKDDMSKLQKKLDQATQKKQALERNLGQIQGSLTKTLSAINSTKSLISQTTDTIKRKELELQLFDQNIQLKKEMMSELLQEMYLQKDKPLEAVVLGDRDFSEAMDEMESIEQFGEKVQGMLDDIKQLKEESSQEKENLEVLKKEHEENLIDQATQKQELIAVQADTQSDIAEQEKVINRLRKELNQLQGDLSKLLGKSFNAGDIQEAVEFASEATGVPKGFLFGMLKVETNLGANVGGCTYAQVESGAEANYKSGRLSKVSWQTFLNRRNTFKGITNELDLDYKKQKVSCNPSNYRGTGGAMGVAQFMPDTWNGYKSQVASITGHNPPSPWNLTDGVTAMALKLKRTPGVTSGNRSAWKSATCSYLGVCAKFYQDGVLYWADNYQKLFK